MEGSLHWSNEKDGSGFTCPTLLPRNTTTRKAVNDPPTVQYKPQDLRLRPCIRTAQLKRGTVFTNWNGDARARQAEKKGPICGA